MQQEEHNEKTFEVFMKIVDANKIYTNQTGRFPVTSSKGTKYLCIAYEYDSNAILAKPMKGRKGSEILMAYKEILNIWRCKDSDQRHIGWTMKHQQL